jgi:hypothetical protein
MNKLEIYLQSSSDGLTRWYDKPSWKQVTTDGNIKCIEAGTGAHRKSHKSEVEAQAVGASQLLPNPIFGYS